MPISTGNNEHATPTRTRVALVDADPLVREGLRSLLDHTSDLAAVGSFSTAAEAAALDSLDPPDLVILSAPAADFLAGKLNAPLAELSRHCPVLLALGGAERLCAMLPAGKRQISVAEGGGPALEAAIKAAFRLGAGGIIRRPCAFERLAEAARTVAAGGQWLDAELYGRKRARSQKLPPQEEAEGRTPARFTARELEIISLIASGSPNREIADKLGLAYSTVKNYVSGILEKLGMEGRTQIALHVLSEPHSLAQDGKRGSG